MTDARDQHPGPGQSRLDRRAVEGLEWARWAVRRWSAFPVDQAPRPLVLVDSRVRIERWFVTGEAKMAFLEGRVEANVEVPARVLDAVASQARPGPRRSAPPLLITAAELLESEFETIVGVGACRRGGSQRRMRLDRSGCWTRVCRDWQPAADAGGSPPDLRSPGQDPGARVDVAVDDRTLVVHWLGAAPEFERYPSATVIESAEAFAVAPAGVDIGPSGARTLAGFMHQVPAVLQEPVGARVYIDLHGHAGRVVKAPASSRRSMASCREDAVVCDAHGSAT